MILRPTLPLLRAYKALPRVDDVRADGIPVPVSRPELLRLVRRMESMGLVEVTCARPKIVKVGRHRFPRSLHAALNDRPHLVEILKDHGLLVLGILATTSEPLNVREIARLTNLHPNTVGPIIRRLARRAFLSKVGGKFKLAEHASDAIQLGRLYIEHLQQPALETHPTAFPIAQHYGRLVVETRESIDDFDLTGASYFHKMRANILPKSHVYAIVPTGAQITPNDAYKDFLSSNPPKRTLKEVKKYLDKQVATNVS